MILITIDIVYRQMLSDDINNNRYRVQTCTDRCYRMILITIDIVYRQMLSDDINNNRYRVQTDVIG